MTRNSIAAALAFGFLAVTLSVLPVTTAEAECTTVSASEYYSCPKGWHETARKRWVAEGAFHHAGYHVTCCTTPSEPYATGETKAEREEREAKECAAKGADYIRHKGKCEQVGVLPGSTTGKKGGFIQMRPTCAEGTTYSESENKCVANPAPAAEEQQQQVEEQETETPDEEPAEEADEN